MGRKPTKPGAIPHFRVRERGGRRYYFYDHGLVDGKRKEEPLGTDYGLAILRWAELERAGAEKPAEVVTFRYVADRYRAEVIPTKAERTQRDNLAELTKLLAFFDDPPCPLDSIEPQHVHQYMRWRKDAPIRATREKALLSHIWNWARVQGYTSQPNPCAGIKGKKAGRDVYVEDDAYKSIWKAACAPLRDAMDLAYLTGQRPSDVLSLAETDIREGVLHVRQRKTGAKLRIAVEGELAQVIARIRSRKQGHAVYITRLVVGENGMPVALRTLQKYWAQACKAAGLEGVQFRDLRAKAATDKAELAGDVRKAQKQLGHATVTTTELYVRARRGEKVTPTR